MPDPDPDRVPAGGEDELFDERRLRASGGPDDRVQYTCGCGFVWAADVSASVACPRCGASQAWSGGTGSMDGDGALEAADALVTSRAAASSRGMIAAELTAMVATGTPLSITHARAGARRVLVVEGTVDLDGASRLAEIVRHAGRDHEPVAIDLCDARLEHAPGVALLVNAVRRLQRRGADVTIVCPPGPARSALQHAGLARRIRVVADRETLAAVAPPRPPAAATDGPTQAHPHRAGTPGRRGALLTDATLAIEARFAEPDLALGDIARQIATSERQLQRVFAELADSAFRDELAAVRMQHAARLLQTSDLTVSAIARRVGYRQSAQFAKAFRRHHGSSPSAFRRTAGR